MQVLQAVLLVVAIVAIVATTWATIVFVRGTLREMRKIGQATEDFSRLLKAAEEELVPAVRDARSAVSDIDHLVLCATETVHRIDRVTGGVERLLDGSIAGLAASKTVKSASATLLSVYEGVRQGIKALRGMGDTDEEERMGNDDERNVLVNVLAGIGIGAIVGAAAGLLLAPKAGSETRQDLVKTAEDLKAKAEELAGQLSETVDDLVTKSKDLVEGAKSKVQQAVEAGKQAVADKRDELTGETEGATEA